VGIQSAQLLNNIQQILFRKLPQYRNKNEFHQHSALCFILHTSYVPTGERKYEIIRSQQDFNYCHYEKNLNREEGDIANFL